MTFEFKPFLRKPKIESDEFLLSYLVRLAISNHYDSMATFNSVVYQYATMYGVRDSLYNPIRAKTYAVLSKLTGIKDTELFQHTIHRFADILIPCKEEQENITFLDGSTFHLADHETHRRNCRPLSKVAFCPKCLKESAYYRLDWHILSTTVCLKHNNLLVDSCEQCGSGLSIYDIVSCRCPKCQFDLRASNAVSIGEDALSRKTQEILSALMMGDGSTSIIQNVSPVALYRVFTGLKYCIQTKTDWEYLHPFPNCNVTKPSKKELAKWVVPNQYLHRLNVSAVKALLDFPNGMYSFWDSYRNPTYEGNIALGLGYFYWGWMEKRWNSSEYSFIQDAYNEYLIEKEEILYPSIAKSQRLLQRPELKSRFKYITMASASKIFQSCKWSVVNLVKNGNVSGKKVKKGKDKFVVLLKDVLTVLYKLENSVDLDTTVKLLGASKTIVQSLVGKGLLESIQIKSSEVSPRWSITIDSITELQERIVKSVRINNDDSIKKNNLPNIARQLPSWGIEMADVLGQLLDGKIEGYISNANDVTLNSIYFHEDTASVIKNEIIKNNGWVSHNEFARKRGVKPFIVYRWVESGLIVPSKIISRTAYFSNETVAEFESNILTTKEASKVLNVGILTVQRWARLGRLKPVSGVEIDGCHEYRFRRADVEAMSGEKRLTAPEMAKALGISRTCIIDWINRGKLKPISGPEIDGMKHYLFSP